MPVTPMTQLEAVNIVLSSLGEPSISTLDGAGLDAQLANDMINEINRSVQTKGWHWNKQNYTISPDVNGFLYLPASTLKVDSVSESFYTDVVQRGNRLYDRENNTFVFTAPIQITVVIGLEFEELPASCRDYIAAQAAITLQQRVLGAESLDNYLKQRALSLWQELQRDEINTSDPNMLRDSWSTYGILQRGSFRRGAF